MESDCYQVAVKQSQVGVSCKLFLIKLTLNQWKSQICCCLQNQKSEIHIIYLHLDSSQNLRSETEFLPQIATKLLKDSNLTAEWHRTLLHRNVIRKQAAESSSVACIYAHLQRDADMLSSSAQTDLDELQLVGNLRL